MAAAITALSPLSMAKVSTNSDSSRVVSTRTVSKMVFKWQYWTLLVLLFQGLLHGNCIFGGSNC